MQNNRRLERKEAIMSWLKNNFIVRLFRNIKENAEVSRKISTDMEYYELLFAIEDDEVLRVKEEDKLSSEAVAKINRIKENTINRIMCGTFVK